MNRAQVVWNSPKTGSFPFHKGILRFQSTNLPNTHATLQFISLLIANHPNKGKQKVSIVMKIENTDTTGKQKLNGAQIHRTILQRFESTSSKSTRERKNSKVQCAVATGRKAAKQHLPIDVKGSKKSPGGSCSFTKLWIFYTH